MGGSVPEMEKDKDEANKEGEESGSRIKLLREKSESVGINCTLKTRANNRK